MPAKLFMDCGWDRSPVTEHFQNLQSDRVWQAHLQELPDQASQEPVQGPQPGLRFICLLPSAGVSMTAPRSLAYGADDRTKTYVAITESSGEGSSF